MSTKKLLSCILSIVMVASMAIAPALPVAAVQDTTESVESTATQYDLPTKVQDANILHCWNWSYNNIKAQIPLIAASGYAAIQTSPVTQAKDYFWEGVGYDAVGTPDGTGGHTDGNWWKVYQPVTMSICDNGYTWFGTKAEFKEMCEVAHEYGVKVIVDIVANHMGNIKGWQNSMTDITPQVGEFWEPAMLTDPTYWHINNKFVHDADARDPVTQGCMGMPDLNTGDSRVQNMVLNLLNECIEAGADGFRFDAAKHIEMPEDDPSIASNFWDVVLNGAKATYKNKTGSDLYVYGEILNRNDGIDPTAYTKRMSVTNNSFGDSKRNDVRYGNAGSLVSGNATCDYVPSTDKAVIWAESHDTYMGGGSSYLADDNMIKQTWAIIGSRSGSTGLYFARTYSYDYRFDPNNLVNGRIANQVAIGDVGTMFWADKSVAEVNKLNNRFIGKSESLGSDGDVAYNVRGGEGVVIAKLGGAGTIDISSNGMKEGTYKDRVSGNTFTVSGGRIKGNIGSSDGIAVLYGGEVKPSNTVSVASSDFTGNSINVTIGLENATSGTYQIGNAPAVTYTGSTPLTLGENLSVGESVTIKLTATNGSSTITTAYTYTKVAAEKEYPTLPGTTKPGSTQPSTVPAPTTTTQKTTTTTTTPMPTSVPTRMVVRGDANGDGKVDLSDAIAIQKHLVLLKTLTGDDLLAANVNSDTKVDSRDVVLIQRYLAEYTNKYDIGGKFEVADDTPKPTVVPTTNTQNPTTTTQKATTVPVPTTTTQPSGNTKTIYVGMIYYLDESIGAPKMHYWSGAGSNSGDAIATATGETISTSVGSSYWGGDAQNFTVYSVTIPKDATSVKFRHPTNTDAWYGDDITLNSNSNTCYLLFEYGDYKNATTTYTP